MWNFKKTFFPLFIIIPIALFPGCSKNLPCPEGMVEVEADEWIYVEGGLSGPLCMDMYEASVWSGPDCTGTQYGANGDDYPATFPDLGNHPIDGALYACSRAGVMPSRYITWFQASQACINSGKRLCEAFTYGYSLCGQTQQEPSDPILTTGSRSPNFVDIFDLRGNANEWTGTRKGSRLVVIYPDVTGLVPQVGLDSNPCNYYFAEGFEPPTQVSTYSDGSLGFRCCQMKYFVGLFKGPFAGPPPDPALQKEGQPGIPSEGQKPEAPFAAPSNLSATPTADAVAPYGWRVDLSWTDNSSEEEGFVLERYPFLVQGDGFKQVGNVGANVTAYSDNYQVHPGWAYIYRVAAFKQSGALLSDYSSPVTTTVP